MTPSIMEPEVEGAILSPSKKKEDIAFNLPAEKHEEYQYLDLIREILETGEHRPDR